MDFNSAKISFLNEKIHYLFKFDITTQIKHIENPNMFHPNPLTQISIIFYKFYAVMIYTFSAFY